MSADAIKEKQRADVEREFARLWRAWRTVHEMVQDRVCFDAQRGNGVTVV